MEIQDESRKIFNELKQLITEQQNPKTIDIDTASVIKILELINDEDTLVAAAVRKELPYIADAVALIVDAFKNGGRLFYIGAGTSGRLGVLDAAECPPSFGTPPELVQGIIAGGYESLIRSREGSEDNALQAQEDLKARNFTARDVLCGLSASKRTPYVLGGIKYAQRIGAKTMYISCTPRSELPLKTDVAVCPIVGPEAIMGSTRMKAGTAEKMVLNMLTTASFIRLGKVYKNMMVDHQMTSGKLEARAKRIVMMVTDVDYETAVKYLELAHGNVKTAIVMILGNLQYDEARQALAQADGFVRIALENIAQSNRMNADKK
jgi:N-acetylmuramic acid 6-phosphate etherase